MHYIFSVEGNIGSGKSTLVKMLKNSLKTIKNTNVIYLPEPVSVWESIKAKDGKNAIEKYYENPEKYEGNILWGHKYFSLERSFWKRNPIK